MEVSVVNRNRNARPSLFEVDSELERLSAAPRQSIINNRAYHESSEYDCVNELSFSGEQIHNQEEINNNSNKNKFGKNSENDNHVIVVPSLERKQRRSTLVNKNDRRRESKNGPDTENKNDTSLLAVSAFVLDDANNDDSVYPKTCSTTKSSSSHPHYDKEEQSKCQHDNNKEIKQKKSIINNKDIEENVKKRKSYSNTITTEPSITFTTTKVEANSTSKENKDEEKDKKAKSKSIAQNTSKDSEEKLKLPMIPDRNRFKSKDLTKDKNAKYDTSDKKTSIHLLSPQGENESANKKVSVTSAKVLPRSIANAELRRESNTLVTTKAHDDEKKLMLNKWPLYQYEQEEQLEQQEEEYRLPLRDLIASSFKKESRSEDSTDAINGNINKKLSNNNFPLNDEECKRKKEKEDFCNITINEESKSQQNNNDNKKSINKKKKKTDCKTVENTKVSTIPQQNQEKQSEVNAKSTLPISKINNDYNNSNTEQIKDRVARKRGKVENCEPKQKESGNSYIEHSSHPTNILKESESKNVTTKNNNNNNNNNVVNESSNNVFVDYNQRSHTEPHIARLSAIEIDDGTHCMATTATSLKKIKYQKNKSITLLDDNNIRVHKGKEEESVKLELRNNVREKEKEKKKDVYNYFCDDICLYSKSSRKKLSICSTHATSHTENNEKYAQTMNE